MHWFQCLVTVSTQAQHPLSLHTPIRDLTAGARAAFAPHSAAMCRTRMQEHEPMDRAATETRIAAIIAPFNKKGVEIADATTFAGDLEFDSLTVMDFVAAVEDEFDIIISMNQQAEIENYGQLIDAVVKLQD